MAGCLNSGTAYLRFRRIYFLEIPIQSALITSAEEELLEARWIVAINDWTSLLLAVTFSLAACINFATLRQLWLNQQETRMFLPTNYHGENVGLGISDKKYEDGG